MSAAQTRDVRRWTLPAGREYEAVNALVSAPLLRRREWRWRAWWIGFAVSGLLTAVMAATIVWVLTQGVGIWGYNTTVVWGFPLANYVWWIGIGNAGTLISSMLLLMRQSWRASINRFAEAMTLFAASIAGLFPILHLGRPEYFYWLIPYPNTMNLWPQWRSALIWDFWAILSYLLFSIIFWYFGMIPDLATLRDRAASHGARWFYGALALGWRGSARHWRLYEIYHTTMACLAVPLVVSLHSVVGLDFAASLMPGWQETIFPPYFVVGAMYSGFAMVALLTALLRWGFRLQALITLAHFDVMAKIMLAASLIMGLSYATEWFAAWYHGEHTERALGDLPVHRALRADLLVHAAVQRGAAASVLVAARAPQRPRGRGDLGFHQCRHVARAYRHRHRHAVARLQPEHVAAVLSDILGLVDAVRRARLLRPALSRSGAAVPDGVDARGAPPYCRGGAAMILLARFARGDALAGAAHKARASGYRPVDAFTPFPIDGLAEALETQPPHIRVAMFIGGAGVAALAYALEWYSAVIDYPIDSGGRPLHSWPTFVLFPFAIGILAAAISGLIAFFWQSGLPRLHHPLFECRRVRTRQPRRVPAGFHRPR